MRIKMKSNCNSVQAYRHIYALYKNLNNNKVEKENNIFLVLTFYLFFGSEDIGLIILSSPLQSPKRKYVVYRVKHEFY